MEHIEWTPNNRIASTMIVRVCTVFLLVSLCNGDDGFIGTAELVRQSSRRSRLAPAFQATQPTIPVVNVSPPEVTEETAARSTKSPKIPERAVRNYDKIFNMDFRNLTDKQRILLDRIVERVAKLGGPFPTSRNKTTSTTASTAVTDTELNESRANHATSPARSVKKNMTKSSTTKTMRRTTAGIIAHPTKPVGSTTTKVGKSKVTHMVLPRPNATEIVLGNITTASIVDSLKKDNHNAREDVYGRPPTPVEKASVKVSCTFFFRFFPSLGLFRRSGDSKSSNGQKKTR